MNELAIEEMLFNWLSSYGCNVFFNRTITALKNNNKFRTEGETTERPDLVLFSKHVGFVAIEVKNGDKQRNIHDGTKIAQYRKDYVDGKTKYYIEDNEIKINLFLLATQHSLHGKLFSNDQTVIHNETIHVGHCYKEYEKTKQTLRGLWAILRRERKPKTHEAGLGILLSGANDKKETDEPKTFCQLHYNNRWNVIWTIL